MPPSLGIVLHPSATWTLLRASPPGWRATLSRHALPLALLPAIAWPIGQAFAPASEFRAAPGMEAGFAVTWLLGVACVLIAAAAIYALAAFFDAARNWDRAFAVAAYASTPMFLAGALLVVPILAIVSVPAFVHCAALCNSGLRIMLGCRAEQCPAYVASAAMFTLALSLALGALCGAAGWL